VRVLFDTSVLVAAMTDGHTEHARCLTWLQRARDGKVEFVVAAHTLAELYAVLSSYPVRPRIPPGVAARLVRKTPKALRSSGSLPATTKL
jgi:predicted nucleic acid-binding protein